MPINKLTPSYTFTEERIAELRAVVPEAFADGKINWEVLQEALGEHVEEPDAEHFGLFWPGKREARRLASIPSRGTLIPVPGEGADEETTRNVFIEGENLEVLKLLQKSYAGRVKMIYIDPPYNTGNDFIYSDDFAEPLDVYLRRTGQATDQGLMTSNPRSSGRYHSNWLSMMFPRLLLAKALLKRDGVIFVSIDDNEIHNLRHLMDEVFGPENFITCVIWQKVYAPKNTARHFSEDHDYIVVYARDAEEWRPNLLPRRPEADARYINPDNDSRGRWKPDNLLARNYYSKGEYEVTSPSGKRFRNPTGTYWRTSREKFLELDKDNRIWWGATGDNMPALKRFLSEVMPGRVPQTLWEYGEVGHTQDAKKQLLTLVTFEQTENVLNTLKPTTLIDRMLHLSTETEESDVVLDFFAGSASTAHAVLEKNMEDGGNRRFIMVQIPEPLPKPEPRLETIADIGKERVRGFVRQVNKENEGQLDLQPEQDLGFRAYRLDRSHFKAWRDYEGQDLDRVATLFDQFESPLVDGWKAQDLLTEILLIEGFPLDSTVTPQPGYTRNTVQLVTSDFDTHRLFVCLDPTVHDETVGQLDLDVEDIFVCLDSALTDQSKMRLSNACNLKVI